MISRTGIACIHRFVGRRVYCVTTEIPPTKRSQAWLRCGVAYPRPGLSQARSEVIKVLIVPHDRLGLVVVHKDLKVPCMNNGA